MHDLWIFIHCGITTFTEANKKKYIYIYFFHHCCNFLQYVGQLSSQSNLSWAVLSDTLALPAQTLRCGGTSGPAHTAPVWSSSSCPDGSLALLCYNKMKMADALSCPNCTLNLSVSAGKYQINTHISKFVQKRGRFLLMDNLQFLQMEACCWSCCACWGKARLVFRTGTNEWLRFSWNGRLEPWGRQWHAGVWHMQRVWKVTDERTRTPTLKTLNQ